jgi:hypothetical protein
LTNISQVGNGNSALADLALSPTLHCVFGHERHGVPDNLFLRKFSVLYKSLWDELGIRPDSVEKCPVMSRGYGQAWKYSLFSNLRL